MTRLKLFVCLLPVQPWARVPVCPGPIVSVGPGPPVPGDVAAAAPLHGPGPPPHAHPRNSLGARRPVLKGLSMF